MVLIALGFLCEPNFFLLIIPFTVVGVYWAKLSFLVSST